MAVSGGGGASDEVTGAIQILFRLAGSKRIHQQQMEAAGVSLSQPALRVLERTIEAGSITPGQLAAKLDFDPAVVTRLVRQLEDAGLVRRRRHAEDRRVNSVEATEAGRNAFDRVTEVIWRQVRRSLDQWCETDVSRLADLLGRLVADVQLVPYQPASQDHLSVPSGKVDSKVSSR